MAYGFEARNQNNNILISDKSYNCVYIGKAGLYAAYNPLGTSRYWYLSTRYGDVQSWCIRVFRIDSGGRDVIPFIYIPWPNFCTVFYFTKIGNIQEFWIGSQVNITPEVYCFAKSTSVGKTGWGMSVFDANEKLTFTSTDNILRLKAAYNAYTPNSSLYFDDRYVDDTYTHGSAAGTYVNAPLNAITGPITKPAINYNSFGTASIYRANSYSGAYYEAGARYNPSTTNLETQWLVVADGGGGFTQNTPARDEIALLIDGANYG